MMKRIVITFMLALILVAGGACRTTLGNFAVLSTNNVDFSKVYEKTQEKVSGEDSKVWVFVFPLGVPTIKDAVDATIKKADVDYLANAKVESNFWYIPFIFGMLTIEVEGEGWKAKAP